MNSLKSFRTTPSCAVRQQWFKFSLILLGALLLSWAGAVHADAPKGLAAGYQNIGKFEAQIVERVSDMVNDPGSELRYATDRLFFAMALGLFIWKTVGWAFRGFDFADMFFTVAQIVTVGALMKAFPIVVPAMFQASLYIGNAVLAGLAKVPMNAADGAALPIALMNLYGNYKLTPECYAWILPGECIARNLPGILAAIGTGLVLVALGIASLITDIWGFWGFAIAMATGLVMLPFVLYPRLSFLFDGWVRFFIGFMVYTIVARANLALVAVALMTFQGATVGDLLGGTLDTAKVPPVKNFAEVIGLLLFAGVGLFTLTATGAFARSMVTGAGGGGVQFSAIARNAVGTISGAASGLINTGGAAIAAGKAAVDGGMGAVVGAAAKGATNASIDATIKGNAAFAKGYTVGREAAAGAINGAARGMKFGADPKTPTGGGVKATALQRAQGVIGGALGGASAAARTTAAVSLGLKVTDSFAEKRQLDKATASANQTGMKAAQALDGPNSSLSGEGRAAVSQAVYELNETLNTATRADAVRDATQNLKDALSEARADTKADAAGDISSDSSEGANTPSVPGNDPGDPYMAAAMAELDQEERDRNGGMTLQEQSACEAQQNATDLADAIREVENDERERYGGSTFAEHMAASDRDFQRDHEQALRDLNNNNSNERDKS